MDLFDSVSPLDYRYYGRDPKAFEALSPYLSENARIRYQARVEAALARALYVHGLCTEQAADEISAACDAVTAQEVYAEEDRIHHDVRALANCIRNRVSEPSKPFVHFLATSFDIIDTANALRYREFAESVLVPQLKELERTLLMIALREKDTLQIGRTHGQHAEPVTFGLAVAGFASRLGGRIQQLERTAKALPGKFSGPVGAYNAAAVVLENPLGFEATVLSGLGLKPAPSSSQIVEPEPLADLGHAAVSAFGVLANLSDDFRHLQRSELAEVFEFFESAQVGSSTMPHKRNPMNFENVKSFWKAFMPRMTTLYMDQVSEHQRDLTNSASQRFFPEMLAGLYLSSTRLNRVLGKIKVDTARMRHNFDLSKDAILAEPLYILLALHQHPDAHEAVRQLTILAQAAKKPLYQVLLEEQTLSAYVQKMSPAQMALLKDPSAYTGIASQKTEQIVAHWKNELQLTL